MGCFNRKNSFYLYAHYTDEERDWVYDRDSHINRLDNGSGEEKKNGCAIVDMESDWKSIYPSLSQ